jgi:hypothetical protein
MLPWVIQITVLSIIMIFLVHHLINFFKSTLTVPKIKDLVNTPSQKYESMYNIIKNTSSHINKNAKINETNIGNSDNSKNKSDVDAFKHGEYTLIDLLPQNSPPTMKNELKNFLKKQLNSNKPSVSGVGSYATF